MASESRRLVAVLGQEDRGIGNRAGGLLARARRFSLPNLVEGASRHGGRMQPAISLIEIVLTLAIALLAGKAFWALLAPMPIAQSPPAPNIRPVEAAGVGNPFKPLASEAPALTEVAPEAVETSLDLKLHGIWADGEGRGTAIILVAGAPQKVFKIGDDICCGAKLEEVYADRAIISRGGAREALYLPKGRSEGQTTPAPLQLPAAGAGAQVVSIQAVDDGGGGMQLRLFPYQDPGKFEALGLRPGDILVSVNGTPPGDAAGAARLISTLSRDDIVSLSVKRDGVEFPLDIAVAEWMGSETAATEY